MVQVTEKKKDYTREILQERLYYDVNVVQRRFKLPTRQKGFKGNPFSFLYELALLSYFFLRDKRFKQIIAVVFNLIKQMRLNPQQGPTLLLDAFFELDSTFIKIGQFLSSRGDLLPKEYIEVLSELQDSLPPLPFEKVRLIIEEELRKSPENVFKSFDTEPIASASIGQVHKAQLLNGINVVVKIQRPDLNILFYHDLSILRCLLTFLERYTKVGENREWVSIVDEIGRTLFEEIDFIQEGRNADLFRKNLKHEERIYIPKIFWQCTTRRMIITEFVPGIKITDINSLKGNNINPKDLALVLVNAYFKQFFEDGFYHADPHPGNIVVKNDGTIVFYDFGMVGRLNNNIRTELLKVLFSIVENDTDTLLNTLKKLDLIKSGTDVEPIKRVIEYAAYKYYDGAKLNSLDLSGVDEDLKKLFSEKPMKLPSKFTYTLRMTGTLEGICRTLNPDFSLVKAATPYFQEWIKEKFPESKRVYLKSLFPNQSKLLDKIKIYVSVIKDLPKYVSDLEKEKEKLEVNRDQKKIINEEKASKSDEVALSENIYFKKEIKEADLKLRLAYSVIFLLCFVFIGNFLLERGSYLISIVGLLLLICSLLGSIGIVGWSVLVRKGEG